MTEKELVENEGFGYYRLPIQDHTWPTAEQLDDFIAFVKELDQEVGPDGIWLHFHCQAGKGRTGIMMMVYDMMRNPQLPMEDILVRQTMLGGNYPLYAVDVGISSPPVPFTHNRFCRTDEAFYGIQRGINGKLRLSVFDSQF